MGTQATLTAEEAAARNAAIEAAVSTPAPTTAFLQPFWNEYGRAPALTSLIADPANGRLPEMTADGARRAREWQTKAAPTYLYAGPQDMRPYDRCITRGVLGSAFPNVYSSGMQILQAPGVVVFRHEMIHEARVIVLDQRPHVGAAIRSYGRSAGTLGRRHTRGGNHELQRADRLVREKRRRESNERGAASDRAVSIG